MKFHILLLYITVISASAQSPPGETPDIQRILDDRIDSSEPYSEEVYENLVFLLTHPLDINRANEEELRFLMLLSDPQIESLIEYRKTYGSLASLHELQAVPEFDSVTIQHIIPFVTIVDRSASPHLDHGNHYALIQYDRALQPKLGTQNPDVSKRYLGSPDRVLMRVRSSRPGDYSVGILGEKDSGEPFAFKPGKGSYGFDFVSAHLQLCNRGRFRNVILGDYQVQAGQGLNFGGVFGLGKGGEVVLPLRRSHLGGIPYTSTLEGGQYRGLLATLEVSKTVSFTTFASSVHRDATHQTDSLETSVSSLPTAGYHRLPSEWENKNTVGHNTTGAVLQLSLRQFQAGITLGHTWFSHNIVPTARAYNQFAFAGKQNTNASAFFSGTIHNLSVFGEVAHTHQQGSAVVAGVQASFSRAFDAGILVRVYQPDYISFFSNAIGESSYPQNESGFYHSLRYRWSRKVAIGFYADLFRFPWLRYRVYAPSSGYEWLGRLDLQFNKNNILYLQFREEYKHLNQYPETSRTVQVLPVKKWNGTVNYTLKPQENLTLHARVQFSRITGARATTHGVVLLHDIKYQWSRVSIAWRVALFGTDDYENRLYVYEDDLWMNFSLPTYFGKGVRNYLVVRYKPLSMVTLGLRFCNTQYPGVDSIGSGPERIDGDQRSDLKFQILIRP